MAARSAALRRMTGAPDAVRMLLIMASMRATNPAGISAMTCPARAPAICSTALRKLSDKAPLSISLKAASDPVAVSKAWMARSNCADASALPAARPSAKPLA